MKTVIFFGAARINGVTNSMVELLKENLLGEVEIIDAYRTKIKPCMDCRYCHKHPSCCVQDGMQQIYQKIDAADNLIIAAPMYFHSLPGPLKIMMDRMQVYWASNVRKDCKRESLKRGAILLCGGAKEFDHQFDAGRQVAVGVMGDWNAKVEDIIYLPNTDCKSLGDREDIRNQICRLGKKLSER